MGPFSHTPLRIEHTNLLNFCHSVSLKQHLADNMSLRITHVKSLAYCQHPTPSPLLFPEAAQSGSKIHARVIKCQRILTNTVYHQISFEASKEKHTHTPKATLKTHMV